MTVEHLLRVFVDVSDMLFKTDLTLIHSGKEKKNGSGLWLGKGTSPWCNSPPRWFEAKKKKMLHLWFWKCTLFWFWICWTFFLHVFLPLIAHSDSLHWSQHEPGPILWPSHCDMELGEPLGMCSLLSLNTEYVSCDTIQRWRSDTLLLLCVVARIFSVLWCHL